MNKKIVIGIIIAAGLIAATFFAMHTGHMSVNPRNVLLDGGNNGTQPEGPHPPDVGDAWTIYQPTDGPHPPDVGDAW